MIRRFMLAALLFGAFLAGPVVPAIQACPMCKLALESDSDNKQPKAYMYSILFMLGAMGSLITSVGVVLYRVTKQERASLEQAGYGHLFHEDRPPA